MHTLVSREKAVCAYLGKQGEGCVRICLALGLVHVFIMPGGGRVGLKVHTCMVCAACMYPVLQGAGNYSYK